MANRKRKGRLGGWRPGAGRKPELHEARSVTFDLEGPDFRGLQRLAEIEDVSVAEVIRRAVHAYLFVQRRRRPE